MLLSRKGKARVPKLKASNICKRPPQHWLRPKRVFQGSRKMVSPLQSNGIGPLCKEEPPTASKEETLNPLQTSSDPLCPLSVPQASSFPPIFSAPTFNPKPKFFRPTQAFMGKLRRIGFLLTCSGIASLGVLALVSCFIAENKRSKVDDLKLDGRICFLPASPAFGFGLTALICLSIAQATGNLLFCAEICPNWRTIRVKNKLFVQAILLIMLSWASFVMATILICAAISMSRRQSYGKGWVDGECYLVKRGVFTGAGVLSLVTVAALLGAIATATRRKRIHQTRPSNNYKDETT